MDGSPFTALSVPILSWLNAAPNSGLELGDIPVPLYSFSFDLSVVTGVDNSYDR